MKKLVCFTFSVLALVACSKRADKIGASYISPVIYQDYSCEQIGQESARISQRAAQAAGIQDKAAKKDAVATGVAVVIFWPAVFLIKGNEENAAELARLKGQMEAIEQVSIQKKCGIEFSKS